MNYKRQKPKDSKRVSTYYTPRVRGKTESYKQVATSVNNKQNQLRIFNYLKRIPLLVVLAILIWAILSVENRPLLQMSERDKGIVNNKAYIASIQKAVGSSLLNTNKLSFQKEKLASELMSLHPEIRSVNVSLGILGRRPEVELRLHDLSMIYRSLSNNYVVNEDGQIIADLDNTDLQIANLLTLIDPSGVSVGIGDFAMRSSDVKFLTNLKKISDIKDMHIESVVLADQTREVHVKFKSRNYIVKMYLEEDVREQFGYIIVAEELVGKAGDTVEQYIDVRAGEKVYWR